MKKPAGKGRSRRPAGRSPVIAVRVSEPLYRQIKDKAKQSRATMSETMARLLKRAFEWDETFAEPKRLSAELLERQKENLKADLIAEMRRQGWTPLLGTPYWLPPEVAPREGSESGFIGAKKVDPIEIVRAELERCTAILKAIQPKEGEPQ